jgi:hypothetical protein
LVQQWRGIRALAVATGSSEPRARVR